MKETVKDLSIGMNMESFEMFQYHLAFAIHLVTPGWDACALALMRGKGLSFYGQIQSFEVVIVPMKRG